MSSNAKNANPDVGVLSISSSRPSNRCSLNEVCINDDTSSLGGRCVSTSSSRRMQNLTEVDKFYACKDKCPDSMICDCAYNNMENFKLPCTTHEFANACSNKEHLECLQPYKATIADKFTCPYSECAVGIEGYDSFDSMSEEDEGYCKINHEVQKCYVEGVKSLCGFCKQNESSFSYCTDIDIITACGYINDGKTSYLYWSYESSCPDYTMSSFESDSNLDESDGDNIGETSSKTDNLNESQEQVSLSDIVILKSTTTFALIVMNAWIHN